MDEMLKDFVIEALDLSESVESNLLLLEKNPDDMDVLNAVFRSFHTIKGGAGFMGLSSMVSACHLTENLFDALRTGKSKVTEREIEVALLANSFVGAQLRALADGDASDSLPDMPIELSQSLQIAIDKVQSTLETQVDSPHKTSELASEYDAIDWGRYYGALLPGGPDKNISVDEDEVERIKRRSEQPVVVSSEKKSTAHKEDSIRVDAIKLDALLEIAGESVQAANQAYSLVEKLSEYKQSDEKASTLVSSLVETLTRATRYSSDLQKATLATRMQPVGRLFQKFPRLVRDLAKELGKDVELVIAGAETEVDRVVVESLYDPLVHMLRNALDHGIEDPEFRASVGKNRKSSISLKAWQQANSVMIELSDDGRGMDPLALFEKAVAKKLIAPDTTYNETFAYQLVFLPGFSTKDVTSSVSGRGVGMDVVKTAVEKNRGSICIESKLGFGTRFSIRLPIELSIVPTMLVEVCGATLGVPISLVQRVIEIPANLQSIGGAPLIVDQGTPLPVRSLGGVLGYEIGQERSGLVMQTDPPYILTVCRVDGAADLVIKPLTALNVDGIAGTARSAEGDLVLVVDPAFVLSGSERGAKKHSNHSKRSETHG